jgi:hypothetical protein
MGHDGYLALLALAGFGAHAIGKVSWADPAAALAFLPLILREGREALHGNRAAMRIDPSFAFLLSTFHFALFHSLSRRRPWTARRRLFPMVFSLTDY